MIIHLTFYGLLREILPKEARGKIEPNLPPGMSLAGLLEHFHVPQPVICSINGMIERDLSRILENEDKVNIFRPAGGG